MKNIFVAIFLMALVGVFFGGCSKNTPPIASELLGGYTPSELPSDPLEALRECLAFGSLSPAEKEMAVEEAKEKLPEKHKQMFELRLKELETLLAYVPDDGRMWKNDVLDLFGTSVPEGVETLITALKKNGASAHYGDILKGVLEKGYFFSPTDRETFGRYLGW